MMSNEAHHSDNTNNTGNSRRKSYSKYKLYKFISYAALAAVVIVLAGVVFGAIIMLLWNATIAELFGVANISFWQAIGLFFLAKLFFGFGSGSKTFKSQNGKYRWAKFKDKSVKYRQFQEFWEQEGRDAYQRFHDSQQEGNTPDGSHIGR